MRPNNNDPWRCRRRKSDGIRKVQIQSNQDTTGTYAGFINHVISAAGQILTSYGIYVVTALFNQRRQADIEILVKFEPHGSAASVETGITRSRVISAANAKAARMSSRHNDG